MKQCKLFVIIMALGVLFVTGCQSSKSESNKEKLDKAAAKLKQTFVLPEKDATSTAILLPGTVDNATIKWISSDETVVKINGLKGYVLSREKNTTVILTAQITLNGETENVNYTILITIPPIRIPTTIQLVGGIVTNGWTPQSSNNNMVKTEGKNIWTKEIIVSSTGISYSDSSQVPNQKMDGSYGIDFPKSNVVNGLSAFKFTADNGWTNQFGIGWWKGNVGDTLNIYGDGISDNGANVFIGKKINEVWTPEIVGEAGITGPIIQATDERGGADQGIIKLTNGAKYLFTINLDDRTWSITPVK